MRQILHPPSIGCSLFLCLIAGQACADSDAKPLPPNVLFIAVDDLNNWVEGLSEYTSAKTPNITRLAERGVLFTNAHCAAPACNPSRASVVTGVHPAHSGVYYNWQDWRECSRLKDVVTLPQHFRDNGYETLGCGKIYHAASLSKWGTTGYLDARPWDAYFPSKSRQLAEELTPDVIPTNGSKTMYKGYLDWAPLDTEDSETGDGKIVSWATQQLARAHDKPFFLAVGIYRPHIPWYTPQQWFDKYPLNRIELPNVQADDLDDVPDVGRAMGKSSEWQDWFVEHGKWPDAIQGYLASVSFADAMVGQLLDALDNSPHADNTAIVLWSDHGYQLGHKQHWEKFTLWEQATHVPLIVAEPGGKNAGKKCHRPVSLLDIYPTLSDLCGLEPQQHLDGESLLPLLQNSKRKSDRAVVTTQGLGNHSVRSQHWRYISYADGSQELYDHRTDPDEFHNVAKQATHEDVIERLAAHVPATNAALNPIQQSKERKAALRRTATTSVLVSVSSDHELALFTLNAGTGVLTPNVRIKTKGKPGAMCLAPDKKTVYVALRDSGSVAAYRMNGAELALLGETKVGAAPSFLAVHPSGGYLLSSYYAAGKVAVHHINDDGTLTPLPIQFFETDERAHCVTLDATGSFVFVPHTRPNAIFQFVFDSESGRLTGNQPAKLLRESNTGPRHLCFHPNNKLAFGSDEQGNSITAYKFDETAGTLDNYQTLSSLPAEEVSGKRSTSDLEVHPSGKFVYIANRGHDSIAVFTISDNGKMKLLQHMPTEAVPRSFNIAPNGRSLVVAGQASGRLAVYSIGKSGRLTQKSTIDVGKSPTWVQFVE